MQPFWEENYDLEVLSLQENWTGQGNNQKPGRKNYLCIRKNLSVITSPWESSCESMNRRECVCLKREQKKPANSLGCRLQNRNWKIILQVTLSWIRMWSYWNIWWVYKFSNHTKPNPLFLSEVHSNFVFS